MNERKTVVLDRVDAEIAAYVWHHIILLFALERLLLHCLGDAASSPARLAAA
jgi:hypothetical protein